MAHARPRQDDLGGHEERGDEGVASRRSFDHLGASPRRPLTPLGELRAQTGVLVECLGGFCTAQGHAQATL